MTRLTGFVLIPAGVSLIFLCALGIWLQLTILNQDKFANSVSSAMTQESSRDAIAGTVVDRLLVDRPLARSVVRNPAQKVISGALGSSLFTTSVNAAANLAWREVFIRGGQPVVLDLVPAKRLLTGVVALVDQSGTTTVNPANVPDAIVIFSNGQLPDLTWLHDIAPVVTWISGLLGIAIVGITFWRVGDRRRRIRLLRISGAVLAMDAVGSFLLLLIARSLVLSQVINDSGKTVLQELFRAFFRPLYFELIFLLLVGALLYASSRWLTGEPYRFEAQPQEAVIRPSDETGGLRRPS